MVCRGGNSVAALCDTRCVQRSWNFKRQYSVSSGRNLLPYVCRPTRGGHGVPPYNYHGAVLPRIDFGCARAARYRQPARYLATRKAVTKVST